MPNPSAVLVDTNAPPAPAGRPSARPSAPGREAPCAATAGPIVSRRSRIARASVSASTVTRRQRAPAPERAGRRARGRRARPRRARLDGRQSLGPRRPHALRRRLRPDPGDHRAGDRPRAAGGDRVRTRTIVEAFEGAGLPSSGSSSPRPACATRRWCSLRRRHPAPARHPRLRAGPALGSAIHAAVAAGCHPDMHARGRRDGDVERDVYLPDASGARLRPPLRGVRRAARLLRTPAQRRAPAPAPGRQEVPAQ